MSGIKPAQVQITFTTTVMVADESSFVIINQRYIVPGHNLHLGDIVRVTITKEPAPDALPR